MGRENVLFGVYSVVCAWAAAFGLVGAAAAQTDRINDTPTGWYYYYGATPSSIDTHITNDRRPFNITPTGSGYDVLLVNNTGQYAAGGDDVLWESTVSSINASLSVFNKRILDLEVVNSLTGTFSAVVVSNSGTTAATGWDWETGLTLTGMANWRDANGLRPIDVDAYSTLAGTRYSIVAVPNTGNNAQGWWWYFGVTSTQVTQYLTQNGARLIDIDVADNSPLTFNVIMVSENPGGGWWHPGLASSQVGDFVSQRGARLTCLQRYTDAGGATKFAVACVDNANDQTRRMRGYFEDRVSEGVYGFLLKEVGGSTLASLNPDYEFHPASMLKILHATYAIDRCAAGLDSLTSNCPTPSNCNSTCPDSGGCATMNQTLEAAMTGMLVASDNLDTKGVENRYGRATLNTYADTTLGLDSTQINTTLGCFCVTSTTKNDMTCRDGVSIYEQIANGSLFNQTWQDTLYDIMINLEDYGWDDYPTLNAVINSEATATNLTSTEISDFKSWVRFAHKAGGSTCDDTGLSASTVGGWASIPFKEYTGPFFGWMIIPHEYTMTLFINDFIDTPGSSAAGTGKEEILREQVREALESWDTACTTPVISNQPDSVVVFEGDDATLQVGLAVGTGTRAYQWQRLVGLQWLNLFNVAGSISGATTNELTLLDVLPNDEGRYRCVVTSVCGSDTSSSALVTVNQPPTGCDSIDFNGDGLFPDTQDIADFIAVFGGGACPTGAGQCGDVDFNNDGLFPDTDDITSLIRVFAGGPCL